MDPKVKALQTELSKIFPEGRVLYQFANELHKFRIERNGPPHCHWLYVKRTYIDDLTEQEIIQSLGRWQIPNAFHQSVQSRWIYLSERGVRDVDEHFGRGT